MNTNTQLLEEVKGLILNPDQSVNWEFLPKGAYINIDSVKNLMFTFVNLLFLCDQKDLSKKVLGDSLYYFIRVSSEYYRDQSGSWAGYKQRYGFSPCCCCDWQSEVSSWAGTLGFEDLSRRAVSIQCPASPSGYRRDVSKVWELESRLDDKRVRFVVEHLQAFVEGRVDFFS